MTQWEVRREGVTIACGSSKTFPTSIERKILKDAGYKIYVDGKLFKEAKNDGKGNTVRQNPSAFA